MAGTLQMLSIVLTDHGNPTSCSSTVNNDSLYLLFSHKSFAFHDYPDSKAHGANMGPILGPTGQERERGEQFGVGVDYDRGDDLWWRWQWQRRWWWWQWWWWWWWSSSSSSSSSHHHHHPLNHHINSNCHYCHDHNNSKSYHAISFIIYIIVVISIIINNNSIIISIVIWHCYHGYL